MWETLRSPGALRTWFSRDSGENPGSGPAFPLCPGWLCDPSSWCTLLWPSTHPSSKAHSTSDLTLPKRELNKLLPAGEHRPWASHAGEGTTRRGKAQTGMLCTASVLEGGSSEDDQLPRGAEDLLSQLLIDHAAYRKTQTAQGSPRPNSQPWVVLLATPQVPVWPSPALTNIMAGEG